MLAVLPCELLNHQGRAGLLNREGNPSFLPRRQGMTSAISHSLSRTQLIKENSGSEIFLRAPQPELINPPLLLCLTARLFTT